MNFISVRSSVFDMKIFLDEHVVGVDGDLIRIGAAGFVYMDDKKKWTYNGYYGVSLFTGETRFVEEDTPSWQLDN